MTNRITSFTERALLNNYVLDLLSPPECQKVKISQTSNSVLEALINSKDNLFLNNTKSTHWSVKPLYRIARATYTLIVTVTVSPIGTICNGGLAIKHLGQFTFAKCQKNELTQKAEWEKTAGYAKACFADLRGFIAGSIPGLLIFSHIHLIASLGVAAFKADLLYTTLGGAMFWAFPIIFLGNSSESAPSLIAEEKVRNGMFLSLFLRDKLGIVNENGKLLNFSEKDTLEYEIKNGYYQFKGPVDQNIRQLIARAEIDLLDLVRQANEWLKNHHLKTIAFSYPFNGKDIAQIIQKNMREFKDVTSTDLVPLDSNIVSAHQLIDDLLMIDRKIQLLRTAYSKCIGLLVNGSTLLQCLSKDTGRDIKINKSFLDIAYYREYFNAPSALKVTETELSSLYDKTPLLTPLQPNSLSAPTTLYDKFKLYVRNDKWNITNNRPGLKLYEFLGLKENYNYSDLKRALHTHNIALHPDKNNSSEESKELYNIFSFISEKLK